MIDFDYEVVYKNVKHVTVKVKPTLQVQVVAPWQTSHEYIESLVKKRREWIQQHLTNFKNSQTPPRTYCSGEDFIYLGKRYRLKVLPAEQNYAVLKNGILYLHCQQIDNHALKAQIIDDFYRAKAENYFPKVIQQYRHLYQDSVTFKIKKMTTRWGSCHPQKRHISLNQALIQYPRRAIEYVVLHEIAHLTYPNHGLGFQNYMATYMPDWRKVKYKLDFVGPVGR